MSGHEEKVLADLMLRDKSWAKRARRVHRSNKKQARSLREAAARDAAFGPRSRILAMMARATSAEEGKHAGRLDFRLPATFSMLDEPEKTLLALASFAKVARSGRLKRVFLDFVPLKKYDLGANALLDVLVDELSAEARRARRTLRWGGTFPTDPALERFVRALGVIKRLGVKHEFPNAEEQKKLTIFEYRCRHYVRVARPRQIDTKSRVSAKFVDHVNECLRTIGKRLVPGAVARLSGIVGEVIDNAEQHSGMYDWAIQGYLDAQATPPMCEIVILNFGHSISETFELLPKTSPAWAHVQPYLDAHTKKSFLGKEWREQELLTLVAMQQHVSSKRQHESDTRGNGTVELVEFFQRMQAECNGNADTSVRMVIASGSSMLLFDGSYKMQPDAEGRSVLAFNDKNDLMEKPDGKYVRKLAGVSFPGTLISLRFQMPAGKSTVAVAGEDK